MQIERSTQKKDIKPFNIRLAAEMKSGQRVLQLYQEDVTRHSRSIFRLISLILCGEYVH